MSHLKISELLETASDKAHSPPVHLFFRLAELKRLFFILDKDGDGVVDASDLKDYIEEAESASRFFGLAIRDAVAVIDVNKDGKITFEELVAFIKRKGLMKGRGRREGGGGRGKGGGGGGGGRKKGGG